MLKCSIRECFRKSRFEGCRECHPTEEEVAQAAEVMMEMIEQPLCESLALWAGDQKRSSKLEKEIRFNGKIATLTTARKGYKCDECGLPIESGEDHYCLYHGGAGLADLKWPGRIHANCLKKVMGIGG